MGAAKSKARNIPDAVIGLSPKQVEIIRNSWGEVQKDSLGYGRAMFMEYFTRTPKYVEMFNLQGIPLEVLQYDGRFKAHMVVVMNAFTYLFEHIDEPDIFVYLLQKNAKGHMPRQIPVEAYTDLLDTIMFLLEKRLDKFTPEVRETWNITLTFAFKVITEFSKEMPFEQFEQRTREILKQKA